MAARTDDKDQEGLKGRAIELEGLVDFQEGSVVSRTIVDRKIGTVTIFAFDAGQGLSEHTAPYDALVYIVSGAAEITISGRVVSANAGDFVIMPANEPHSLRANERFKMLLIMIRA